MKYTATIKWEKVELNYDPKYEPLDFLRNNDELNLFTIENWKPKIDMETVLQLMVECYKNLLETNYL